MNLAALDPEQLEFIASIISSLFTLCAACAWPGATIILVLALKDPILKMFPILTKMKAGGFEFEFGKRIVELEKKADDADIPEIEDPIQESIETELSRLYRLSEINKRSAILEAWLLVESTITLVAMNNEISGPELPSKSLFSLLKTLTKKGVLSPNQGSIISELRQLRNSAVHDVNFDVGMSETLEYIALAVRLAYYLRTQ